MLSTSGQGPRLGTFRHGGTDAVGRSSGLVEVTLLALMSQRFQPLLSPTAHGPFVMIVRSSTFMHHLPAQNHSL